MNIYVMESLQPSIASEGVFIMFLSFILRIISWIVTDISLRGYVRKMQFTNLKIFGEGMT